MPAIAEGGAAGGASGSGGGAASMWRHLPSVGPDQRVTTRVRTMWTGVGATLARDVPFSAIYWQLLEPTRRALLPADGADSSHSQVRRCSRPAFALLGDAKCLAAAERKAVLSWISGRLRGLAGFCHGVIMSFLSSCR